MLDRALNNVIICQKNLGETPLLCLERVRKEKGISHDTPMTYAGRLDPMAEGLMLILTGDECKNKEKYLGLNKTYEFEILVGFKTDTEDLLGIVKATLQKSFSQVLGSPLLNQKMEKAQPDRSKSSFATPPLVLSEFEDTLKSFLGTFMQKYPSFSSKTVNGKQLFQLALDGDLPRLMPEHEVTIFDLQLKNKNTIKKEELKMEIIRKIGLVQGNFRQNEITDTWKEVLNESHQEQFEILALSCNCSSGTYIRELVADIGKKTGVPLVTYSINRTKIGDYKI